MDTPQSSAQTAAAALPGLFPGWCQPRAFVQLGTGFEPAGLFDEVLGDIAMSAAGLVSPRPSVAGCPLRLLLGRVGPTQLLVGHGHRYCYEGGGCPEVVLPVVAAALTGVRDIILVEPGLVLHEDFAVGSWLALTDYINAMGVRPAEGFLDLVKEPFLDMTDAFSQSLNAEIINAAARIGASLRLGVYQATGGPQFDTPAEAEAARRGGADVLGNGIIPETVVGTLLGCRVSALVLVADAAASYGGRRLRRASILDATGFCSQALVRTLRGVFATTD